MSLAIEYNNSDDEEIFSNETYNLAEIIENYVKELFPTTKKYKNM